ncbi:hypothetical protein RUM44_013439 [Polyplax serrata]|uniref:Uncharacterized protein n=1 Tax=Polyplax serrata TaxID=468196 RepID=A0ABR1BI48_POLSC
MQSNKNFCSCKANVENTPGQQQQQQQLQLQPQPRQGPGQQQQETPKPGVCKKEMALMQILAEQMKPPPLQVSIKVGVPKRNESCSDNDGFLQKPTTNNRCATRSDEERKCPLMAENLKAIQERKKQKEDKK